MNGAGAHAPLGTTPYERHGKCSERIPRRTCGKCFDKSESAISVAFSKLLGFVDDIVFGQMADDLGETFIAREITVERGKQLC